MTILADMLTRIRDANTAMHDEVRMPSSKQKVARARSSNPRATSAAFAVAPSTGGRNTLTIQMKYSDDRDRPICRYSVVSPPGPAGTRKASAVPRVLGGLGVAVLSTSHGLMTRPRSAQAQSGRRSPLLRLVRK